MLDGWTRMSGEGGTVLAKGWLGCGERVRVCCGSRYGMRSTDGAPGQVGSSAEREGADVQTARVDLKREQLCIHLVSTGAHPSLPVRPSLTSLPPGPADMFSRSPTRAPPPCADRRRPRLASAVPLRRSGSFYGSVPAPAVSEPIVVEQQAPDRDDVALSNAPRVPDMGPASPIDTRCSPAN
ncbi:hypothetical protein OBBRIDRAFT_369183 [Obba rivulosa]|uniref:Uncharacterized protein n=1 Tax=Obba rivulosa TaxID=1052685 RepID=A0A8E2DUH3_9APHY|nr:hypothetical protein OBBRIDRAFT_369183 [Obba rivulosa]